MKKEYTKHKGTILEGRWEVIRVKNTIARNYTYVLKNIFSGEEISISGSSFNRILRGKTSVSQIRAIRCAQSKKNQNNQFNQSRPKCYKHRFYALRKEAER